MIIVNIYGDITVNIYDNRNWLLTLKIDPKMRQIYLWTLQFTPSGKRKKIQFEKR